MTKDEQVDAAFVMLSAPVTLGDVLRLDCHGDSVLEPYGKEYIVVSIYSWGGIVLCRIPPGMSAMDLGRRFWHSPTAGDPQRFTLSAPA